MEPTVFRRADDASFSIFVAEESRTSARDTRAASAGQLARPNETGVGSCCLSWLVFSKKEGRPRHTDKHSGLCLSEPAEPAYAAGHSNKPYRHGVQKPFC